MNRLQINTYFPINYAWHTHCFWQINKWEKDHPILLAPSCLIGIKVLDINEGVRTMPPSLLVVNDETNFILLLERILSRDGYQVTAVHGSEEALYQLGRKSFDLAILDIKMYPMNGVELLAEIKKRSPSTRVIMVSGNLTDDIREQCKKLGAIDCLTKPIQISELKAVVRDHAHAPIQYGEKSKAKPLKRV